MAGDKNTKRIRKTRAQRDSLARQIRSRYENGASIRALAQEYDRSYAFIHRVLSETGSIPSRHPKAVTESESDSATSQTAVQFDKATESMTTRQSRVFVSYSKDDAEYARQLAEALELGGVDVSLDSELDVGSDFAASIEKEIERCDLLIAVFSPNYFQSTWCKAELATAMTEGKRVIPVRLIGDAEGPLAHLVAIETGNDFTSDLDRIKAAINSDPS